MARCDKHDGGRSGGVDVREFMPNEVPALDDSPIPLMDFIRWHIIAMLRDALQQHEIGAGTWLLNKRGKALIDLSRIGATLSDFKVLDAGVICERSVLTTVLAQWGLCLQRSDYKEDLGQYRMYGTLSSFILHHLNERVRKCGQEIDTFFALCREKKITVVAELNDVNYAHARPQWENDVYTVLENDGSTFPELPPRHLVRCSDRCTIG
jgi:hypothetical protein